MKHRFYSTDSLTFSKFTDFIIFTDLLNTYCTYIFLHSSRNISVNKHHGQHVIP